MTDTKTNKVVVSTEVRKPTPKPRIKPIGCLECDKLIEPVLRVGAELEPDNEEIKDSRFWQCPTCQHYVGTSVVKNKKGNSAYIPLGSIPTKEIANARSSVYDAIMKVAGKLDVSKSRIAKALATTNSHTFRISSINSTEQAASTLNKLQEVEEALKTELENALPAEVAESRRRVIEVIKNTCETSAVEVAQVHEVLAGDKPFSIEDINTLEDTQVVITKLRAYRKAIKA